MNILLDTIYIIFLTKNDVNVVDVKKREAVFKKVILSVHLERKLVIDNNNVTRWGPIVYVRLIPPEGGDLSIQGHIIHFQSRDKGRLDQGPIVQGRDI